jgi:hypothetical protein
VTFFFLEAVGTCVVDRDYHESAGPAVASVVAAMFSIDPHIVLISVVAVVVAPVVVVAGVVEIIATESSLEGADFVVFVAELGCEVGDGTGELAHGGAIS